VTTCEAEKGYSDVPPTAQQKADELRARLKTYSWTELTKAQQSAARELRDRLNARGVIVTVSQIARYFNQSMDYSRGHMDEAVYFALVSATPPDQVMTLNPVDDPPR
jgi:hypothetical protein